MIPVYRLTADSEGHQEPCWRDVVFGFKMLESQELARLSKEHKRNYTGGSHFVSFCCEPTKFLPYLMKRFLAAGGRFEKRKVASLDEITDADIIVNCAGLGAKEMTNDKKFQAIRGQVARVKAPWMYDVTLHEDDDGNYVIPNTDCVVLGGTHQIEDYNTKVSPNDSAFIFRGCQRLFPTLVNAETLSEVVGLRPGRESVRLETEIRNGKSPVIHNVGHGGCGVTLCWGCSDDVLGMTVEALKVSKL
jgi:D-amino-acid oxidase